MGQNNSFRLNITDIIKDWIPLQNDPSIFLNLKSRHHLQCFHVKIALQDLMREVTIYNARIQAIYPHICRIEYFNQEDQEGDKAGYHTFAVYTDHLFQTRENEWSIERFAQALEAMLTLISYYGYFRLTEKMVAVNERGETKVWISENPVNNHRDFALNSEEQALAAFAKLVTLKNYQVANLIIGCCTLQDALLRLKRPKRMKTSPLTNLSFRANLPQKATNVGNEAHEHKANNLTLEIPLSGQPEHLKFSTAYNPSQVAMSNRSVSQYQPNLITPNMQQFQKKRLNDDGLYAFPSSKSKNKKVDDSSFDHFPKTPKEHAKFYPFTRFQTTADLKSNKKLPSPKNKHQSAYVPFTSPLFTPKNAKPHYEDITIINNNVSHVVNNITHNHSSIWNRFREARTPEFNVEGLKKKSQSPSNKRDKSNVPHFLLRKKEEGVKSFHVAAAESSESSNTGRPFFLKTDKTHNSGINMLNKHTQESFKSNDMESSLPQMRKPQKLYTFCPPSPQIGKKGFSKSFTPHGQGTFTPPSMPINKNHTQFFKKSSRTKTADLETFQHKFFKAPNKSFETKHAFIHERPLYNQTIQEDVAENLTTFQSIPHSTTYSKESPDKNSLKRQLKLEFGNLLGQSKTYEQQSMSDLPSQSSLKDKIQQKKIAFAQLKKQAMAVLTDLL